MPSGFPDWQRAAIPPTPFVVFRNVRQVGLGVAITSITPNPGNRFRIYAIAVGLHGRILAAGGGAATLTYEGQVLDTPNTLPFLADWQHEELVSAGAEVRFVDNPGWSPLFLPGIVLPPGDGIQLSLSIALAAGTTPTNVRGFFQANFLMVEEPAT